MIRIDAVCRGQALQRITVCGHGLRENGGESASCAAVSALIKALGLVLVRSAVCEVRGTVQDEGQFDLLLDSGSDHPWMHGVWDLTKTALMEVQRQWPGEVLLTITEADDTAGSTKGDSDGT